MLLQHKKWHLNEDIVLFRHSNPTGGIKERELDIKTGTTTLGFFGRERDGEHVFFFFFLESIYCLTVQPPHLKFIKIIKGLVSGSVTAIISSEFSVSMK